MILCVCAAFSFLMTVEVFYEKSIKTFYEMIIENVKNSEAYQLTNRFPNQFWC